MDDKTKQLHDAATKAKERETEKAQAVPDKEKPPGVLTPKNIPGTVLK